jgi:hypothetical protein
LKGKRKFFGGCRCFEIQNIEWEGHVDKNQSPNSRFKAKAILIFKKIKFTKGYLKKCVTKGKFES